MGEVKCCVCIGGAEITLRAFCVLSNPSSLQSQGLCMGWVSAWIPLSPDFWVAGSLWTFNSQLKRHLTEAFPTDPLVVKQLPIETASYLLLFWVIYHTHLSMSLFFVSCCLNVGSSRAGCCLSWSPPYRQCLAKSQVLKNDYWLSWTECVPPNFICWNSNPQCDSI